MKKICTQCKEEKELELFNRKAVAPDGRMAECRECNSLRAKARREKYPDKTKAWTADWRSRNKEHIRQYDKTYAANNGKVKLARTQEWRDKNRDKVNAYARKYEKEHREHYAVLRANREAAKLRAVPKLPELEAEFNELFVKEVYRLSRLRTKLTGITWNVDHKVPLRSRLVCGFHCYTNLDVILAKENRMKSNKEWPDKW